MAPTSPSAKLTRDELHGLALSGVRERVRAIERELARLQREFPALFITDMSLVLLAPEQRTDGKTWPLDDAAAAKRAQVRARISASWTPARRQQQAERMREQRAKTAKTSKKKKKPQQPPPSRVWEKMRAFLVTSPDHRATSKELQQAIGTNSVAIANSAQQHNDIFKRVATGVYTLTAAGKASENGAQP